MTTLTVVTEVVPGSGSCTVNAVTGIAIDDVVAMYPGAAACSTYVPAANVAPNANAPVASVVVVNTFPDESTSTTAAAPMPFVVPACTTSPVNPYVVVDVVLGVVVDDGVIPVS